MQAATLWAVVEGPADEAIVRTLADAGGFAVGPVFVKGGKKNLDPKLRAYAAAALHGPWLVLRDLDHDAGCAPDLIRARLPESPPNLLFRIPVRSVEAWLLADREALARYVSVPVTAVPSRPEELDRPKRTLVDLARRSRSRSIRHDMVPAEGTSAEVGLGFTARIIDFATDHWSPTRAAERSDSLARCLEALRELHGRLGTT
jgi:hypothetical protein